MAEFTYPYNFIRPGVPSKRGPAKSHAKFEGLSGTIHCKLVTKTPIFTPDPASNTAGNDKENRQHRVLEFFQHGTTEDGKPQYMIPGTSLKGMVRSVAETLSNSCWSQFDGDVPSAKLKKANRRDKALRNLANAQANGQSHSGFLPCTHADKLCFCCRLFGFVRGGQDEGPAEKRDPDGALGGRVSCGFARATKDDPLRIEPLRILSGPTPKYAPFYLQDGKAWNRGEASLRGRKFYWHHEDHSQYADAGYYTQPPTPKDDKGKSPCPDGKSGQNATVTALKIGAEFTFDVDFCDLNEEELGCLWMSLMLWSDSTHGRLSHKLGMGKPLGLGSCVIKCVGLEIVAHRPSRYQASNLFTHTEYLDPEGCRARMKTCIKEFRAFMCREAGAEAVTFETLPQVSDAEKLWGPPPKLDIQYYPPCYAVPPHKPFEYFMRDDVKRKGLVSLEDAVADSPRGQLAECPEE